MKYKIEKNIPIPVKSNYPFDEMEIGDSFEIDIREKSKASGAFRRYCEKRPPLKFSLRTIDEKHARIWRVENRKTPIDIVLKEIDQKRKESVDLNKNN